MRSAPGPVEWLTFPAPEDPDRQFRVNVSFLLSNYMCIFGQGGPGSLNKRPDADYGCCERGVTGKSGCAFHHLAAGQGKHHTETKPFICWSVPLNFSSEDPVEPGGLETTIVSAFTADAWGGTDDDEELDGLG